MRRGSDGLEARPTRTSRFTPSSETVGGGLMLTDKNSISYAAMGVLLHSERLPRVQDLQDWIDASGYPCTLDSYGLDDERGLISANVLGTLICVRIQTKPLIDARPSLLAKDLWRDYDLNVQFDWSGILGNRALSGLLQLAAAETSGGLIWGSEHPQEINHQTILRLVEESLELLKLLRWVGDNKVLTHETPELSQWESPKLRRDSISRLHSFGIIEGIPEEQHMRHPHTYKCTCHGSEAARMCY